MINQPHHSSAVNQKSPIPAGMVPKALPNQPAQLCSTPRSASAFHYFRSEEKRGGKSWDCGKAVEPRAELQLEVEFQLSASLLQPCLSGLKAQSEARWALSWPRKGYEIKTQRHLLLQRR